MNINENYINIIILAKTLSTAHYVLRTLHVLIRLTIIILWKNFHWTDGDTEAQCGFICL